MIRNIMGVVIEIGLNKKDISYMEQVLAAKARSSAGKKVSPTGLYFIHVKYPLQYNLDQNIEKYLF